ncbi:MAG: hypothetical protein HY736_10000 [Verrucomicrobia bacterium]|nr:hypothetical protein [Verrucomicrobiota bacterium]
MPERNPDPTTVILAELMQRLADTPYIPFTIVMSNGDRHEVPTADHLTITRLLRRVELETDEPRIIGINPLHVATIERAGRPAA